MTTVENKNGLELLSGRLVTLFLTLASAEEAVKRFPAGTHVKVTNDPNPDLNGEYLWDGVKLVKTTNNTLEKAKEQAEKVVENALEESLSTETILDLLNGAITGSELDRRLEQRIDKIPSISGDVEQLKDEVSFIQGEVNIKINNLTFDFQNVLKDVANLQSEIDADFQEIKDLIDEKFVEVDDIRAELAKEIQDRITSIQEETTARVEAIKLLNDGLTQEILDRKEGDKEVLAYVDNYKVSNEESLANIREEVKVAVDTSIASASKVDAMDARVTSAENNSTTALENSANAVTKVNALATDVSAVSTKVDSMEAQVIKAVDDSGQALTNSATAITQSQTAVDTANAVSSKVDIVEAKLNDKSTTYRQDEEPTTSTVADLTKGDIWINPSKNNEQKRWDGTKWVDISDLRVGDNATAISKLTATVSEQGDAITAQSNQITDLEVNLGEKADASALNSLKATVTEQGGNIQTNTEAITALQGSIDGKADAKALSDLQVIVTQQGDDITSQGLAITSVEGKLDGKADSSTVEALKSTVTQQGEDITAQGQALTGLKQEIDGKASSQVVDELKSTVTQHGDDITAQGKSIESLKTTVDGKADAQALNALTTTVSEQGGVIDSHGQSITSLQNSMAGKADATVVQALESRVTEGEGKITSQGQAITGLQNSLEGKADASALNQLKTTVEDHEGRITAQGQSITSVEAKVDNIAVGSENLITDAGVWNNVVNTDPQITATLSQDLTEITVVCTGQGNYVTAMLDGKTNRISDNCNENDDVIFSVELWIENGSSVKAPNVHWKDSMSYSGLTLAKGQELKYSGWYRFYQTRKYKVGGIAFHFGFGGMSGTYKLRRPIVERGNIPTAWNLSSGDFATAKAVQLLDTKVTNIDQKVDVNASAITDIRSALNNKADASALNSLKTTVTEQGNTITSQGTAITSVTAQANKTADRVGLTQSYVFYTHRNGSSLNPKRGVYNANGAFHTNISRGLNVYTFSKVGEMVDHFNADTYGDLVNACTSLNQYLDVMPVDTFVAIVGHDHLGYFGTSLEPQVLHTRDILADSFGLPRKTTANWLGNNIPFAVGKRGSASISDIITLFVSDKDQDWYSVPLTFIDGIPVGWGGTSQSTVDIEANATAITKLDAKVVKNGQDISANASAITGLQSSLAGKADASALNSLKTTVEQQGSTITSQGTALTQVESNVNIALNGRMTHLDLRGLDPNLYFPVLIPQSQNKKSTMSLQIGLNTYSAPWSTHGGGGYALSLIWEARGSGWGAQDPERRVINFSCLWTAQSCAIGLGQLPHSSQEYIYLRGGTQYDMSTSIDAGTPRLVPTGQWIGDEWIEPIGYHENLVPKSMTNAINGNAIAVNNLDSKVTLINGKVEAQATALTKVETVVGNGAVNILRDSNIPAIKPQGSNPYPFWSHNGSKPLVRNKWYTVVFSAEFTSGGGNSIFAPYIHGNQRFGQINYSFGRTIFVHRFQNTTFDTGTDSNLSFYIIGGQPDQNNAWAHVHWACMYEDDVPNPPQSWQPNSFDNSAKVEQSLQSINGIKAQWTIKTDVNGYVAGAGLMNDGNTSEFIIRADRFAIANPAWAGTGKKYGFVYQSSDKWLPNGTHIPAGLYIDNLILGDIDAKKINAESIRSISANLGTFESGTPNGQRTVISGSSIQVFDAGNVERIFLGVR